MVLRVCALTRRAGQQLSRSRPKGRNEDGLYFPMAWLRHHNHYEDGRLLDADRPYWPPEPAEARGIHVHLLFRGARVSARAGRRSLGPQHSNSQLTEVSKEKSMNIENKTILIAARIVASTGHSSMRRCARGEESVCRNAWRAAARRQPRDSSGAGQSSPRIWTNLASSLRQLAEDHLPKDRPNKQK